MRFPPFGAFSVLSTAVNAYNIYSNNFNATTGDLCSTDPNVGSDVALSITYEGDEYSWTTQGSLSYVDTDGNQQYDNPKHNIHVDQYQTTTIIYSFAVPYSSIQTGSPVYFDLGAVFYNGYASVSFTYVPSSSIFYEVTTSTITSTTGSEISEMNSVLSQGAV